MAEAEHDSSDDDTESRHHAVSVVVNEQKVEILGPRTSGLAIKEAAIAQGLPIDLGFQLIEELAHGRTRVVGDSDNLTVHPGSRFLAVAPDDNS